MGFLRQFTCSFLHPTVAIRTVHYAPIDPEPTLLQQCHHFLVGSGMNRSEFCL